MLDLLKEGRALAAQIGAVATLSVKEALERQRTAILAVEIRDGSDSYEVP